MPSGTLKVLSTTERLVPTIYVEFRMLVLSGADPRVTCSEPMLALLTLSVPDKKMTSVALVCTPAESQPTVLSRILGDGVWANEAAVSKKRQTGRSKNFMKKV